MARPKKRPALPATRSGLVGLAIEKAKVALTDEKTQKMLLEQGKTMAANAQDWYQNRRARADRTGEPKGLGEHFGQRKLERRVENLTESVDALGGGRPELAEALTPVSAAITQLQLSVEIAGRLPLVKRTRACLKLDRELDRLEEALFEASFASG